MKAYYFKCHSFVIFKEVSLKACAPHYVDYAMHGCDSLASSFAPKGKDRPDEASFFPLELARPGEETPHGSKKLRKKNGRASEGISSPLLTWEPSPLISHFPISNGGGFFLALSFFPCGYPKLYFPAVNTGEKCPSRPGPKKKMKRSSTRQKPWWNTKRRDMRCATPVSDARTALFGKQLLQTGGTWIVIITKFLTTNPDD